MANNILKLTVEDSEYNAKLKKAAEGIRHLAEVAHKGGGELTGLAKSELDYIKALGEMETKSRTASGQVRELSNTYKELKVVYNQLNDVEKADEGGKALAASLETIKQRAQAAKKELADVTAELDGISSGGKGGFLSGIGNKMDGALAVFGGNMLTKGVTMLTSELAGSVQQSIELAKQGEGVRMAFERLNQPGLLDNLKAATHGTVSEIELMKQAIKFENFKLPVEALANYLAFAQQKAKDTGESIDFLVTSIVNGLGRQSKQILDNLGISAAELTQRMNEGATMTEAVSAIIKEEMAKAGDYVETAADRAARATAQAQDKAEAFGRTAIPVAEEWAETWATLSQDAMSFANTLLGPVAKSIRSIQNILNSGPDVDDYKNSLIEKAIAKAEEEKRKSAKTGYQGMGDRQKVKAPGGYVEVTDSHTGEVIGGRHFDNLEDKNAIKDWQKGLNKPTRTPGSRSNTKKEQTEMQQNQTRINELTQQYVTLMAAASEAGKPLTDEQQKQTSEIQRQIAELEKRNGLLGLYQEQAQGRLLGVDVMTGGLSRTGGFTGFTTPQSMSDVVRQRGGNLLDDKAMKAVNEDISRNLPKAKEKESPMESGKKLLNGISQLTDGLEKIGIDIPDEVQAVIGVIQGVMQVIEAVNTIIGVTQTTALTSNTAALLSLESAIWANTFFGFSNGGIVPHAASGYFVGGHNYSGDVTPIMANAGELILNKAQQGNLASQLEGGAFENLKLDAVISGEQIRLVLNNNGRRTGRGEYVQSTRRRG